MQENVLNVYWFLPNKVLSFSFDLLLHVQSEVVHRAAKMVLEVLEVKPVVVDASLLSMRVGVNNVMLYTKDSRQRRMCSYHKYHPSLQSFYFFVV